MEKLSVIKIGGNVVDNEEVLSTFLKHFSALEQKTILVHGGGKIATRIATSLGIESQMVEGRRVTDAETLDVVTMVYGGLTNKKIVAQLQANGTNALGLTGADANIIQAHKRTGSKVDYGFVGDIDNVNGAQIASFIKDGLSPVFCALSHNGNGSMLNTNADTIASEIAVTMSNHYETELVYCFELPGVLKDKDDPATLIPEIDKSSYQVLKEKDIVADGMIPKLDNCFNAIDKGVESVRICHADNINSSIGTKLF